MTDLPLEKPITGFCPSLVWWRRLGACIFVLLALSSSVSAESVEDLIIQLTNQERARVNRRNLKPLVPSAALNAMAMTHSTNQASTGIMDHDSKEFPAGFRTTAQRFAKIGLDKVTWAENVFMKYPYESKKAYARAAVRWWMHSPPHRANILDPNMRYIGVGVAASKSKPGLIGYATQLFASSPGDLPLSEQ